MDLNRIRQLAGLQLNEAASPFNNQLDSQGSAYTWSDGKAALEWLDSVAQGWSGDGYRYPKRSDTFVDKDKLPAKAEKLKKFIMDWQQQHGAHAPIDTPDNLLNDISKTHKATVSGVRRGLEELENTIGEIEWYEMQAAPHANERLGTGWTLRVEGKVKETGEPIQYGAASFMAAGAGQRFFRYQSNGKRPFNQLSKFAQ